MSFAKEKRFYDMDGDKVGALVDAYLIRNEVEAEELLDVFLQITGCTSSMGVGESATEAYLGLKLAKSEGGGK